MTLCPSKQRFPDRSVLCRQRGGPGLQRPDESCRACWSSVRLPFGPWTGDIPQELWNVNVGTPQVPSKKPTSPSSGGSSSIL